MKKMNLLSVLLVTLTSASATAALSPTNQRLLCVPVSNPAQASFQELDLSLDAQGVVSGTYTGTESGGQAATPTNLPTNLNDKSPWMTPTVSNAKLKRGLIQIDFDFQGRMGDDEDDYSLSIDAKTGKATMKIEIMTDCGDGRFHKQPSESYSCAAPSVELTADQIQTIQKLVKDDLETALDDEYLNIESIPTVKLIPAKNQINIVMDYTMNRSGEPEEADCLVGSVSSYADVVSTAANGYQSLQDPVANTLMDCSDRGHRADFKK